MDHTMDISKRTFFFVFIFTMMLSACGGGGGGGNAAAPSPPPPPAPVATNPGGLWLGSTFDNDTGLTFQAGGIVSENREGRFINENGVQFTLTGISGNDGAIQATIVAIAPFGSFFRDGSASTTGTLTGTVVERSSISGDWTLNTGETGTVTMSYQTLYDRGSSLADVASMWTDPFGATWSIDGAGAMFSQDAFGCTYNGTIGIIDPMFNAYSLQVTVAGTCAGIEGNYSGLAFTDDVVTGTGTNDLLVIQMDNGDFIFTEQWLRQ
jgi:hypothetical protein